MAYEKTLADTHRAKKFQAYDDLKKGAQFDIANLRQKTSAEIKKLAIEPSNVFGTPLAQIATNDAASPEQKAAAKTLDDKLKKISNEHENRIFTFYNEMQNELNSLTEPLGDQVTSQAIADLQKKIVDKIINDYKVKIPKLKEITQQQISDLFAENVAATNHLRIDTDETVTAYTDALNNIDKTIADNLKAEQERLLGKTIEANAHRHRAVAYADHLNNLKKPVLEIGMVEAEVVTFEKDSELANKKSIFDPNGGKIYIHNDGQGKVFLKKQFGSSVHESSIERMLMGKIAANPNDPNASKVANFRITNCNSYDWATGEWRPSHSKAKKLAKKCYETARKMGFEEVNISFDNYISVGREDYASKKFEQQMEAEKQAREEYTDTTHADLEDNFKPIIQNGRILTNNTEAPNGLISEANAITPNNPVDNNKLNDLVELLKGNSDTMMKQLDSLQAYSDKLAESITPKNTDAVVHRASQLQKEANTLSDALVASKNLSEKLGDKVPADINDAIKLAERKLGVINVWLASQHHNYRGIAASIETQAPATSAVAVNPVAPRAHR